MPESLVASSMTKRLLSSDGARGGAGGAVAFPKIFLPPLLPPLFWDKNFLCFVLILLKKHSKMFERDINGTTKKQKVFCRKLILSLYFC